MLRLNFRSHPSQETLSEYLDGRLHAPASERLEAHFSSCLACGRQLEELPTTVGLLRQVPMLTPRRSFILTEAPAPSGAVERRRARPPAWAAALATSAAAVAFFAVLSADLSGGLSSTPTPGDASPTVAPAAAAVEETQSSAEAQLAPEPGGEDSSAETSSLEMAAPAAAPLAEDGGFESAAQQAAGEVERVVAEPEAVEELVVPAEGEPR